MVGCVICGVHRKKESLDGVENVGDQVFLVDLAIPVSKTVSKKNFHLFG